MDHIMMLFCFFVCIFCGYTTAVREVGSVESVTYNVNTNGSVTLTCQTLDSCKIGGATQ